MARIPATQRRQDLVEAAFRVMSRDGISAATTRAICTEAGVPQSIFHYCFHTKEDLLRQLARSVVVEMGSPAPKTTAADLESSLAQAFDYLFRSALERPDRQLVLYELTTTVLRDPGLAELARWQYGQYYEAINALLSDLAERFDFRWAVPTETVARLFTVLIDGAILSWLADRNTEQTRTILDLAAKQLAALVDETSRTS